MEQARVIVEVVAGLIPQQPEPEFTQRWAITSNEWHGLADDVERAKLLAETNGKAQGYAGWLMMQPDRLNWVRTDWIWP